MTLEDAIESLQVIRKHVYNDETFEMAIDAMKKISMLKRLTEMYAQKGHTPAKTITMEELKELIK